jgi:muramidase (phage lysozyme)
MFATGRFQIIPDTLKEAVRVLNTDVNAQYDEAMQDKIFEEYLIKLNVSLLLIILTEMEA